MLKELGLAKENVNYKKGRGCETCNHTGYKGRTALMELLVFNESISEKILNNADSGEIKKTAKKHGLTTLREAGINKIKNNVTTVEEIYHETVL
jgi:type IV pilus assembly protein PilB